MPRKGENIYRRKDGRWEGRYIKGRTLDGKAIYGYIYAKSYKEVKSKLYHVNTEGKHSNHEQMEIVSLSFGMIALQWLTHIEPQLKESTYIKYRNLVKAYVIPFLGNIRPQDFSNHMLNAYCSALMETGGTSKTGLSPKTVSDVVSVIRSIMNYVSHLGYPVMCDAKNISMRQSYKEMRILSTDEQERLQVYIYDNPTLPNLGILICLYTGIRIGELCALSWDDISLSEKTLHITKTMQRLQYDDSGRSSKTRVIVTEPKSQCSFRTIPLPDSLVRILENRALSARGFFLTGSENRWVEPRTMQNHFKRLLKNCSIDDANFHALRHTFATRCIELGFDVKSLSEILGHASVNITMNRYVHPSMEYKRSNMERLSTLFAVK